MAYPLLGRAPTDSAEEPELSDGVIDAFGLSFVARMRQEEFHFRPPKHAPLRLFLSVILSICTLNRHRNLNHTVAFNITHFSQVHYFLI